MKNWSPPFFSPIARWEGKENKENRFYGTLKFRTTTADMYTLTFRNHNLPHYLPAGRMVGSGQTGMWKAYYVTPMAFVYPIFPAKWASFFFLRL